MAEIAMLHINNTKDVGSINWFNGSDQSGIGKVLKFGQNEVPQHNTSARLSAL